jgi:prevent-host-death family protein
VGAHEFRERFGYWIDRAAAGAGLVVTRHGRPTVRLTAADREVRGSSPAGSIARSPRSPGRPGLVAK